MKIACIQQYADNVSNYADVEKQVMRLIDEAAKQSVDLIVLPECAFPAYYLGFDKNSMNEALERVETLIDRISKKAVEYCCYISLGITLSEEGRTYNSGLLFNRQGRLVNRTNKSNLWHFDSKWFTCGTNFEVVETDIGKIGMMICADGRAPEIARILALKGAELIIDMANLTSTGKDNSILSNPQVEYMLPVRALENGVWIIMSDKAGMEAQSIVYSGRSCIINPEGEIVASASSNKEEILYADIEISAKKDLKSLRRPKLYDILTEPVETLPVYKDIRNPVIIENTEFQASVVQFEALSEDEYLKKAAEFIRILEDHCSELILLPQLNNMSDLYNLCGKLQCNMKSSTVAAITGFKIERGRKYKTTLVFSGSNIFGEYSKLHIEENERNVLSEGNSGENVINTPCGRIGVIHDKEALIPEASRCLMLNGAEIILWSDNNFDHRNEMIAKTRAAENKVYILRSGTYSSKDYSFIGTPDGRIIASTFRGTEQAASSLIITAMAKSKTVVPGTNVVLDRKPVLYKELVK